MLKFDAGSFSDLAETNIGKAVWEFLTTENSLLIMQTATYLERPALEPMQAGLLAEFGDEIRLDRWKQCIGRMARQIMEYHGYRLDRNGVRIRVGDLFTSASRYVANGA